MRTRSILAKLAVATALAAIGAPCLAGSAAGTFDVRIVLNVPGAPPTPGTPASSQSGSLCISQAKSDSTGGVVRVVCNPGQFVSIEPRPGSPFLGVHGGAFRYYFASTVPESLRYLGGDEPWVGPGTVTSIRINYPEGQDGVVEMLVGF